MILDLLLALLSLLLASTLDHAHDLTADRGRRLRRHSANLQHRALAARATAPPPYWSLYVPSGNDGSGCLVDSSTRVLPTYLGTGYGGITACLNACQARNMPWAGVEAGNQCYCSATAPTTTTNAPSSSCNYGCPNTSDKCGGSWRIQVYSFNPPATVGGWYAQGCVSDGAARALTGPSKSSDSMTAASCVAFCANIGYTLAGTEAGYQCFCGNSLSNGLGTPLSAGSCSYTCAGGGSANCGGYWAMNLFQNPAYTGSNPAISSSSSSSSSSTATTTSTSTTTSASKTSSSTVAPTSSSAAAWSYMGCYSDSSSPRTLSYSLEGVSNTMASCLASCQAKGYTLGGIEYGYQCYCGNSVSTAAQKLADTSCSSTCPSGDKGCGGSWAISLWSYGSASSSSSSTISTTSTVSSTTLSLNSTSIPTANSTLIPTANTTSTSSTVSPSPTATGFTPTNSVPASSAQKYVWAHVIVGNTYPYTYASWVSDINLAAASGIDGFILNFGYDTWQPARIADAYQAAKDLNTGFKMMLSLDMDVFTCSDTSNVPLFQSYLANYTNHPVAAKINGKSAVTTFSGSGCTFGQSSVNAGWSYLFGNLRSQIYFMPAYNSDPQGMGVLDIDAEVNWGSAWPSNGQDIETSRDQWFMTCLNPTGKKYVGTISPGFFTHFSYKNWIWRGDNWLYAQRWEQLISMRASIDQVEITTWNDYGESDWVGPIEGDMPTEAKVWTTTTLDHSDVLSMNAFYATAWKTGKYPTITKDQAWIWARPHAAMATASNDPVGPPTYRDYTQDNFYAQVHLTANATVTLCAGTSCKSFAGSPGINRFAQAMVPGSGINVQVVNNGKTTVNLTPAGFTFTANPVTYNYNYLIKSS